jgi:hypothetical protein
MNPNSKALAAASRVFLPSKRAAAIIAVLGIAALGAALFLRYFIVQNTEIGIACETGADTLTCKFRLAVIMLFVRGAFGWGALIAAAIQLWRPNVLTFAAGFVLALLGLVLYNTRASALAAGLLVLSLARPSPEAR